MSNKKITKIIFKFHNNKINKMFNNNNKYNNKTSNKVHKLNKCKIYKNHNNKYNNPK